MYMYIYKIKRFKRKKLLNDRLKGKFFIYDIQNTFHASYDIRTFTFQRDKSTYIYIYIYIKNLSLPPCHSNPTNKTRDGNIYDCKKLTARLRNA